MNKSTLKALEGSIAKWEGVIAGTVQEQGRYNCPLCHKFWGYLDGCGKCPVKMATRKDFCMGTPHEEWVKLNEPQEIFKNGIFRLSKNGKRVAQAELDFLKSLLPKDGA